MTVQTTSTMKMLIGGQWVEAEKTRPLINPYNGQEIGLAPQGSAEDLERAVQSATDSFQTNKGLSNGRRAEILLRAAALLKERSEAFAESMTLETGKPIKFSRLEAERATLTLTLSGEEARRLSGEYMRLDLDKVSEGRWGVYRKFPIGPVGAISPFNFPLNLVAHKVAPAIAAGCTVVLKPASVCPGAALLLGEVFMDAGLPAGMFNIVPCSGSVAQSLAADERIKKLTFTGSAPVGWKLKQLAYRKPVTLELGGNAGAIVEPDADLDFAVGRLAIGSFGQAGQVCTSVQRIFVHQSIYDTFRQRFLEYTENEIKVGDPLDPETIMGPMIELAEAERIEEWVNEAVAQGARIAIGGTREGALYHPTVVENIQPTMKVSGCEVFGPVVTLEPYDDFEDAVERVNDSDFGLQAGLFSFDLRKIEHAYQTIQVGGLIVNDYPTYRIENMPYGGVKDSGFGSEGIRYAVESMTESRLLAIKPN